MEAHALKARGWSISAIARHLDRDRKTVRAHLAGVRVAGVRAASGLDPLGGDLGVYVARRLEDDPHVWASVLFDEAVALGFTRSYPTFTKLLRSRELRPHCEPCAGVKGRATIEIAHPPGEEIQWDWLELPTAPWGGDGHLLVGSLPFSGRFRGVFADAEDQPHLIAAMHEVMVRLGGTARRWRVDRLATVIKPGTADVQASFVPVAKHYGVGVDPCPPRRGNRKGSVEKSIHYLTQRWWRTMSASSMSDAQASLDRFCQRTADARRRPRGAYNAEQLTAAGAGAAGDAKPIVGLLATLEELTSLPGPFPATVTRTVKVGASALARFEGNSYSVPPGLIGATVECRHRLGTTRVEIATTAGMVIAEHRLAPRGAGEIVRSTAHAAQLERVVLDAFSTDRPCPTKTNRPPSVAALDIAARITGPAAAAVIVDLAAYQAAADRPHSEAGR